MVHLPPKQDQISTISEITSGIKRILEDHYPAVWVKGEVSNLRHQSSGHLYFSLKDEGAQLSAVMFRGSAQRLQMHLKDGMEVIALGNLSVYEPRGTYQLIIRECLESGAGLLQAEFERLKSQLQAEGLFDAERKKPIPPLPRKIGIITSPTGAALRDFLSILHRRKWTGNVIVFPAIVQGKEGAPDILQKLQWAEEVEGLQLLVIGRGGGSLEDLWNFNEEAVVRAVAACSIPVISAVGHEIDFVLTDFVADKRAETPSAAAELISSGYVEVVRRLKQAAVDLKREGADQLLEYKQRVSHSGERLRAHTPARYIENRHLRMDELQERFHSRISSRMQAHKHEIKVYEERIKSLHPQRYFDAQKEKLKSHQQRLSREVKVRWQEHSRTVEAMSKRLASLSFENVLQRGYAVIRSRDGKIVTEAARLKDGNAIHIQLRDGRKKAVIQDSEQLNLF